jgi:hypothetical protein
MRMNAIAPPPDQPTVQPGYQQALQPALFFWDAAFAQTQSEDSSIDQGSRTVDLLLEIA